MMHKLLAISFLSVLLNSFSPHNIHLSSRDININRQDTDVVKQKDVFDSLLLGKLGLARIGFDYAMLGYNNLRDKGLLSDKEIISIIDFSLPSNNKRMFVIDLKNYKLLFSTYVAHGRNSGTERALYFSNEPESFKSSVGFYVTRNTYSGKHGFSLKLDGYEKGYNDKAEERAIVIHSAEYVSEVLIKQQGFIGRSLGCPALTPAINKSLINTIKNNTCLFVFGNDAKYIRNSKNAEATNQASEKISGRIISDSQSQWCLRDFPDYFLLLFYKFGAFQ